MLIIGNITTETYRDNRYVKSCANCGSLIYDGEEMEQHSLERYLRMKENMRLIH